MKQFVIRFLLLLLCIATIQTIGFGQGKGRIFNVQAEQRVDGCSLVGHCLEGTHVDSGQRDLEAHPVDEE